MPLAPCRLQTSLPEDALHVHTCIAEEGLSHLSETRLTLLSLHQDILATKLLGKPAMVTLDLGGAGLAAAPPRYLSGYVSRFEQSGFNGRFYVYEMALRPWLWLLTRTSDCRIFQEMTVPDIVKAVFQNHPVARYRFTPTRRYRTWTYCVQYRESDFNFVARLLEHEGIYWYFEHDQSGHQLVLCDSADTHTEAPGCGTLPFYANGEQVPPQEKHISRWHAVQHVLPGTVSLTDYDFQRPSASLLTTHSNPRAHDFANGEIFDFPGNYREAADGKQYAEDRLDEIHSAFAVFTADTNAQGVCAGHRLAMWRHPRTDQNGQYLVTSNKLSFRQAVHESHTGESDLHCSFSAIPAAQQFRPPRRTPKPAIAGPQTATVTGPNGEEIFTDKYGRVKVQFHWDRRGARNEKSSCWVSVAYPWAGASFGGIWVPRIGQEVIVSFLEGDPDAPIIIGRAYNGQNLPPWDLPANATKSGFLTRSSLAGGAMHANALCFEDKKGQELLLLHAEKDQQIEVENDETHTVGHDRTKTIGNDENVTVKRTKTQTVGQRYYLGVGGDMAAGRLDASAMSMEDSGHIDIFGKQIKIGTGLGTVLINQDGSIEITGTSITLQAGLGKVHIDAGGIVDVKGPMVKINS